MTGPLDAMTLDEIIAQSDELLRSWAESSPRDALRLVNNLARWLRAGLPFGVAAESNRDPRFENPGGELE